MTKVIGTPVNNGDETETVQLLYRTPLSNQDKIFARLRVE